MSKAILGHRVGKTGELRVISAAVIFDEARERVLLTQRADNGRWCLPGGGMDPGENAEEACIREAKEETGLDVRVKKLIGIYTSPDLVVEYPDGNRIQAVVFSFEAKSFGGLLSVTDETIDYGYFTKEELDNLDILEFGREEILDAMINQPEAFVK